VSDADRARTLERVRQSRDARRRELLEQAHSPACAEDRLGCSLPIGARVFDRVTGQIVEVIGGTVENVIVPASQQRNGGNRDGAG
jgi:hypothetical protein